MNGAGSPLPDLTELVAIDPARNIRRRYSIAVSIDLFGAIIVETRWGRIGASGQAKRLSFPDRAAAEHHVAATLRRRDTAESRIGVPYRSMAVASVPIAATIFGDAAYHDDHQARDLPR